MFCQSWQTAIALFSKVTLANHFPAMFLKLGKPENWLFPAMLIEVKKTSHLSMAIFPCSKQWKHCFDIV
jgi:hypothetical protein